MTENTLKRATDLKEKIRNLNRCIGNIEYCCSLRVLGRSFRRFGKLTLWANGDVEYIYCNVSEKTKDKIIQALEEERDELQKEFDGLQ